MFEAFDGQGLFTDLYELTMAQSYWAEQMNEQAVFEIFFRKLPANRQFIIAAGLDDCLNYLENYSFTDAELNYLRRQELFHPDFLNYLSSLRFTGDVYGVPEGTPVFPQEPIIQIVAPIGQAQLVETALLNQIHLQSCIASKAARIVIAAQGRNVVDFGSRRAHGFDAALKVAKNSYLVGARGTSNVKAGQRYNIPILGTMAHSYIQAHDDESAAFRAFTQSFPETTLLVDTYDTLQGVDRVIQLSQELGSDFHVKAVRLDSGDLSSLAFATRERLDAAGLNHVKIFASSSLDEFKIAEMVAAKAPIDGFGVGTKLAVSEDLPALDMAYKLVEYANEPRFKLSSDKVIYPGRKQIFRQYRDSSMAQDILGRYDEDLDGQPLLRAMMANGQRTSEGSCSLPIQRQYAQQQIANLPPSLHELRAREEAYPVNISPELTADLKNLTERYQN
jgi:nicotinate phosphoribosyltransferase